MKKSQPAIAKTNSPKAIALLPKLGVSLLMMLTLISAQAADPTSASSSTTGSATSKKPAAAKTTRPTKTSTKASSSKATSNNKAAKADTATFFWFNPQTPVANILTSAIVDGNALYANTPLLYKQGYSLIPLNFLLTAGPQGGFSSEREIFDYLRFVSNRNQVFFYTASQSSKIPVKDFEKIYWDEIDKSCTQYPQNWLVDWPKVDAGLNKLVGQNKITAKQKFDTVNDLNFMEFELQMTCALAKTGYRAATFGDWQRFAATNAVSYAKPLANQLKNSDDADVGLQPVLNFSKFLKANTVFGDRISKSTKNPPSYNQNIASAWQRIRARVFNEEQPMAKQQALVAKYTAPNRLQSIGISLPPTAGSLPVPTLSESGNLNSATTASSPSAAQAPASAPAGSTNKAK